MVEAIAPLPEPAVPITTAVPEPVPSSSAAVPAPSRRPKRPRDEPPPPAAAGDNGVARTSAPAPPPRALAVVTVTLAGPDGKRPQLKYDPSVPMSREETSEWRRERRRERNRASAAACRRRQRDRIAELEAEAALWRGRFDVALVMLERADAGYAGKVRRRAEEGDAAVHSPGAAEGGPPPPTPPHPARAVRFAASVQRCATPPTSTASGATTAPAAVSPFQRVPEPLVARSGGADDLPFPLLGDARAPVPCAAPSAVDALMGSIGGVEHCRSTDVVPAKQQRLTEMLSRPAVKITGAAAYGDVTRSSGDAPPLSMIDDLLRVVPDSCLSSVTVERNKVPCPFDKRASVVSSEDSSSSGCGGSSAGEASAEEEEDGDLGEFLADAVQWL